VGGWDANRPPGKLNVKTGRPLSLYFGFSILLVFSRLLFCVFPEYHPVIYGFTTAIRIRHLSGVVWVFASRPPSAKFSPWIKPKLRHVYQWLFGCIGPCFLCWQICERDMSGLDRGRLWSLYQRMFSHSCSKVLTVDGVYFNFKPVVWDLKKCWFYLNISADLSHKLLGKGGNSSFVKCPPLNWKVGCSIHSDWVNCRSVPWAWAFTSTALART